MDERREERKPIITNDLLSHMNDDRVIQRSNNRNLITDAINSLNSLFNRNNIDLRRNEKRDRDDRR